MTKRRTLDPKLDIVFWMLFGQERNKELLLALLSAVLRPEHPITSVEVLRSEPERSIVTGKAIALDLRVRLSSGEQIDIEMQTQRRAALPERMVYYWARMFSTQLSRGDDYTRLRRCAVVLFVTFPLLQTQRFHSLFLPVDPKTGECLTTHFALHVVELSKLPRGSQEEEPSLLLWAKFFAATTDEELEILAMQSETLKRAKEALEMLSADEKARILAEQRETAFLAYKMELGATYDEGKAEGLAEGKAEGLAEGKAEGRAEGKAEGLVEGKAEGRAEGKAEGLVEGKRQALISLLESRFGSLTSSAREHIAGATESEIDTWTLRIFSARTLDDVLA